MINNSEKSFDELLIELKSLNKALNDKNIEIIKLYYTDIKNNYNRLKKVSDKKQIQNIIIQNKNNITALIAILIRVNELCFNYIPRDIQLISLIFFIIKENNLGLIEQVATGEGKSTIISFLAVIEALKNKKVDILTSSIVLAERDAKEKKEFYNYFNLSVDYCRKDSNNNKTNLICYDADICYGDCLSFEGDILRSQFKGILGRGLRPFDCIIIDEIDNICIDNITNITQLLDNFPGYEFLYFIYFEIFFEIYNYITNNTKNNQQINQENLIKIIKQKIYNIINTKYTNFPNNLINFINIRIESWCISAFESFIFYKKNQHYIITKNNKNIDSIVPVDFSNTGTIEHNSVWTGLHQFLQIKEGLRLTEENLNSCFMSNLSFFKKYISNNSNNIFGLSGTLGSKITQEALNKIYNLNLIFIPTFKKSQFIRLPPKLFPNKNVYLQNLIFEIKNYYDKGRALLIIFEYIEDVKNIKQLLLKNNINKEYIIEYVRDDDKKNSEFLNKKIGKKMIILSTNLSGRGTDIKIENDLEQIGGLHVILTFFPISERIEKQALGRAGRKGEKGSGELFLISNKNYNILENERETNEKNKFNYLMTKYIIRVDTFPKIFDKFCIFLKKYNLNENFQLDLKERWGLFLVENDLNIIKKDLNIQTYNIELNNKYNNFEIQLTNDIMNKKINNPFIIFSDFNDINEMKKISELNSFFYIGVYYMYAYLNKYKNIIENMFNKIKIYIKIIINELKNYQNIIFNIIKKECDLTRQINEKIEVFELLSKNINDNLALMVHHDKHQIYSNLKIDKIYIKDLILKNNHKISDDIIKYFNDLGIYFIYNVNPVSRCNFQ